MCFLSVTFLIDLNREQVNKQVIFINFFTNKQTSDLCFWMLALVCIMYRVRYSTIVGSSSRLVFVAVLFILTNLDIFSFTVYECNLWLQFGLSL